MTCEIKSCLFEYLTLEELAQWMRRSKKTVQNKLSKISVGIAAEHELPAHVKLAGKVVFPVKCCEEWSKRLIHADPVDTFNIDQQKPRRGRKRSFH